MKNYLKNFPDRNGFFGKYGGAILPPELEPHFAEIARQYDRLSKSAEYLNELRYIRKHFQGRPTPISYLKNLSEEIGGAQIYVKREDLNHTGAHKLNHCMAEALLAKHMGKSKLIAETGAGQHGVATAIACSLLGLKCKVYMGAVDCQRQQPNVFRMKLMGAEVIPVTAGSGTLKDAVNEALRDWSANYENAHYLLGTAAGPHPFPTIVREFQKMIGEEAKAQFFEEEGRLPDYVIAAVGGGSNAIGMFNDFIEHEEVKLICVEAGGKGIDTDQHGATLVAGSKGMLHGNYTYIMQDKYGQIQESYSISAGLDYPAVGPQHAFLKETGRAQYVAINDDEALDAFQTLAKSEGIIPALESSHALAQALKMAETVTTETIYLVNLSGRGDKDLAHVHAVLHPNEQDSETTSVKHRGEA